MIEKLEALKKKFMDAIETLDKFEQLPCTKENRIALMKTIKGLESKGFVRKDEGEIVKIHLKDYHHQVSEVVSIGNVDNKFMVDTWRLWKMVHGVEEQISEYMAED